MRRRVLHSGSLLGDIDGRGDVVRSDLWFENLQKGEEWTPHALSESHSAMRGTDAGVVLAVGFRRTESFQPSETIERFTVGG